MTPPLFLLLLFLRCYALLFLLTPIRIYLRQSGIIVLAAVLSLTLSKVTGIDLTARFASPSAFVLLALQELFLGALIGLPFALAIEAASIFARVSDVLRGAQYAEQIAPESGARVSVFENIMPLLVIAVVLYFGGHHYLIRELSQHTTQSFRAIALSGGDVVLQARDVFLLVRLSADAIAVGVITAAPIMILILLIDLAAGLLSRALARVNMQNELMPAKLLLGALIVGWIVVEKPVALHTLLNRAVKVEKQLLPEQGQPTRSW